MSDEQPTKIFEAEDRTTQPMIETLLREFRAFRVEINARLTSMEERFDDRIDRVEAVASQTRADVLTLRADFKELRAQ